MRDVLTSKKKPSEIVAPLPLRLSRCAARRKAIQTFNGRLRAYLLLFGGGANHFDRRERQRLLQTFPRIITGQERTGQERTEQERTEQEKTPQNVDKNKGEKKKGPDAAPPGV